MGPRIKHRSSSLAVPPTALYPAPGEPGDAGYGIFSGNAFVNKKGEATIIYHGWSIHPCAVARYEKSPPSRSATRGIDWFLIGLWLNPKWVYDQGTCEATPDAVLLKPPLAVEKMADAVFCVPPLTVDFSPDDVLDEPPLTLDSAPDARLDWPPLTLDVGPDASLVPPPLTLDHMPDAKLEWPPLTLAQGAVIALENPATKPP